MCVASATREGTSDGTPGRITTSNQIGCVHRFMDATSHLDYDPFPEDII